jgi:glycosyltransferase involved in cell wall biosynthesis
MQTQNNHFTFVVASYNCEKWAEKNLTSIISQKYQNYDIFYIDDNSTDYTFEKAKQILEQNEFPEDRVEISKNAFNKGKMENVYNCIKNSKEGTIVVIVDGDDWLINNRVLSLLNKVYEEEVWMTNGSYEVIPSGQIVSPNINSDYWKGNIRHKTWEFSHLGTFRRELFLKIKLKDMLRKDGVFFQTSSDQAMMWPMAEMASKEHFFPIYEPLYAYNFQNPLSDHCVKRADQLATEKYIRNLKPYEKLEAL